MIATGGSTGSLDGHYLHHGEANRNGQYVEKSERVKFSSARHLAGDPENRHHMTKQLRSQATKNDRAEKPFFHAKLSLDTGERTGRDAEQLSRSEWEQVMGDYAEKMDLGERQCWMVVHKDTEHEHAHLYFNRVGESGTLWSDSQSWPRSQDAVREIEKTHGLRRVQGTLGKYTGENLGRSDVGQRKPPERGQQIPGAAVAEYKRTGEVPFAMHAKEAKEDLRNAGSWRELEGRLAVRGMELEESGGGAVLRKIEGRNKHRAPLHKVDRQSTFPKLEQRLGPYHERDRGHEQRTRAHENARGLGDPADRARGAGSEMGTHRGAASGIGEARRETGRAGSEEATPGDRGATDGDRNREGAANERDHGHAGRDRCRTA